VRLPRLRVAALASRVFFSLLNAHSVHTPSYGQVDDLPGSSFCNGATLNQATESAPSQQLVFRGRHSH